METILQRIKSTDEGTFGLLYIPSKMRSWWTIECPWRDNKPNVSCIPEGTYDASMVMSPRFKKSLYRLDDSQTTPRSAILLHSGNWAGDIHKGYKSDLQGCIALGKNYNESLSGQQAVTNSVAAFNEFYEATKGLPIRLSIYDVRT